MIRIICLKLHPKFYMLLNGLNLRNTGSCSQIQDFLPPFIVIQMSKEHILLNSFGQSSHSFVIFWNNLQNGKDSRSFKQKQTDFTLTASQNFAFMSTTPHSTLLRPLVTWYLQMGNFTLKKKKTSFFFKKKSSPVQFI